MTHFNGFRPVAACSLALCALAFNAMPAHAQFDEDDAPIAELTKGEQRLAEMLEGRVAGEPQDCIRTHPNEPLTTIDGTAYVYGRGDTIYVQRTQNPESIKRYETLVQRRFGSVLQLCKLDIVTTIDPVLGFFTGTVFFEDFIPYTRVDEEAG
ncbi:MAG: hypothetical protein V2J51_17690 [Erythrobacter sp.]|nr:hypothetical protein [Erythrobacter sp.]